MATLMPDIFDKPVVIHRDGRVILADTVTPERLREARHRMASNGRRVRYEVRHAPHNMTIAGHPFKGGQFIPDWAMAMATPQEKAMISGPKAAAASGQPAPTGQAQVAREATQKGPQPAHSRQPQQGKAAGPSKSETPKLDQLFKDFQKWEGLDEGRAAAACSLIAARAASVGEHVDDWIDRHIAAVEHEDREPTVEDLLHDPTNFAQADADTLADYVIAKFEATGMVSAKDAMLILGSKQPKYLHAVANFIASQRKKLVRGEMTPRDVAKALAMTVASQGSGEMSVSKMREKLGSRHPFVRWMDSAEGQKFLKDATTFNKKGHVMIRPEEAAAGWLLSPQGKAALDATEHGRHDPKLWEGLAKVRQAYGDDRFKTLGVLNKATMGEKGRSLKATMGDVGEITRRINEAKGDPGKIEAALRKLRGIGDGKIGFIQHLLGMSGKTTVDAVQINFWLTGHGDIRKIQGGVAGEQADMAREVKKHLNGKVGEAVSSRITGRMDELADLIASTGEKRPSLHILHHWLWDKAKGLETTHWGMYKAQRFAQADKGGRAKGLTQFLADNRAIIKGFKGADLSTAIHELGHVMRRDLPPGDMAVAAKWAGALDGQWHRHAEERFARGLERYVRDGKSPTPELNGVFEKAKGWMRGIYQWIRRTPISMRISPEMRGVYDRMFTPGAHAPQSGGSGSHPEPKAPASRFLEPDPKVREQAEIYARKSGIPHDSTPLEYRELDLERAKRIADHYEAATHNPGDPRVRRAYDAMKRETADQWHHLIASGAKLEPWTKPGQPYADSKQMREDVLKNNHLYFFTGGDMPADHPLAAHSGIDAGGKPLTYNDVFRAVHDWFGHALYGNEFGPRGEEHAWRTHRRMFSDRARPAMTAETRGQNSWVNFGKHLRDDRGNVIRKGEPGYVPPWDRPYAQQKATLLPDEFTRDDDDKRRYSRDNPRPERPWTDEEEREHSDDKFRRKWKPRKKPESRYRIVRLAGGKARIVRYEQRHAPHTMTIAGRTFRGGWYIPDDYYAQATPQQKAMLVHAPTDTRPEPKTSVPEAPYPYGPPEGHDDKRFYVKESDLPHHLRGKVHPEDLRAIRSKAGLRQFIRLYEEARNNLGGRIPDVDELVALAEAGKSARGQYHAFGHAMREILGPRYAKAWALTNAVLSAQSAWRGHTVGAMKLVAMWAQAGEPTGEAELRSLVASWWDIRRPNGNREYPLLTQNKTDMLVAILSDLDRAGVHQIGGNTKEATGGFPGFAHGKTRDFTRSFLLDPNSTTFDTHMSKLTRPDLGVMGLPPGQAQNVESIARGGNASLKKDLLKVQQKIMSDPPAYAAYKAAMHDAAELLGWKPVEVQECVWAATVAVQLMGQHGFKPEDMLDHLTNETVGQAWDMMSFLRDPEIQGVLRNAGASQSALAALGGQGAAGGGPAGVPAVGTRVSTADRAAFERAARRLPPATRNDKIGLGIKIVPPGDGKSARRKARGA